MKELRLWIRRFPLQSIQYSVFICRYVCIVYLYRYTLYRMFDTKFLDGFATYRWEKQTGKDHLIDFGNTLYSVHIKVSKWSKWLLKRFFHKVEYFSTGRSCTFHYFRVHFKQLNFILSTLNIPSTYIFYSPHSLKT